MPFGNPAIGGTVLVRTAEQSANYVAGTSGWRITRDGNAEFNNGTFRGSLTSGTNPGAHVVLNNPLTGDAVDVYDVSNNLVTYINALGVVGALDPSTGYLARLTQGQFQQDDGHNTDTAIIMVPAASTAQQGEMHIIMSPPVGITYLLRLLGGSDDGSKKPTLIGNERNIQGSLVQTDSTSTDNLIHPFSASGTTNTTGFVTLNHGAAFTPTKIICQVHGTGVAPAFGVVEVMDGTITSTQFQLYCSQFNGTARNTGAVTVWGIAIG